MTVHLVGAGPGDPGLLTRRGAEVLSTADVVVHDRLADASVLSLAPPGAELLDVGKAPGAPVPQEDINDLLVAQGRRGLSVVRLKGGDPFVFGRGGEEAQALIAAGIDFEVVPGVTSAVAAPAYAGIPLTHRGLAASFTVVTGHSGADLDRDVDWRALAVAGGTVVVLMGVGHRAQIAAELMAGGMSPATPVAAVRFGTRPEQTTVRTTLAELGAAGVHSPATIVIGDVAGLDLGWYEQRPLIGRTVVVTRAAAQASGLSARLRHLGARPLEVPTIEVAGPADGGVALEAAVAALRQGRYRWVVFSSPNAVARVFVHLRDARDLAGSAVAAMGPGTAEALAERGVRADLVPQRSVAEGLLADWPALPDGGGRVLVPRAAVARPVLPAGLRRAGWDVDVVEAYRTVPVRPSTDVVAAAGAADAICFTSASTVTNFLAAAGPAAVPAVVVSIGPATTAAARAAGVEVTAEADPHSLDGLVDAVTRCLRRAGAGVTGHRQPSVLEGS